MNANEVIANRALELMGHQRGEYQYCSPNDHVNRSQSTNDAYPTAIHIGMYYTHLKLVKHFEELIDAFQRKAEAFKHIIKMGRTQLEDAVPMTLGQTFNGFASILRNEIKNLNFAAEEFLTVNTEDMKTKEPNIILRAAHALPDQVVEMFKEDFETNDIWKHFQAVKDGKVYDLPYEQFGMSATFAYQDALETLKKLLYTES